MSKRLNQNGFNNALNMIHEGRVVHSGKWSISPQEENSILGMSPGDNTKPDEADWARYDKMHLGVDPSVNKNTKGYFHYPMGKGGMLWVPALEAIRDRAGQQHDQEIFNAAGELLKAIDREKAVVDHMSNFSEAERPSYQEALLELSAKKPELFK
ncbi:MAG: hypothetical protein M0Z52_03825 [Actinomycetota bacterium]|nr:hypothetical protein [Actinomycetota bacterium]